VRGEAEKYAERRNMQLSVWTISGKTSRVYTTFLWTFLFYYTFFFFSGSGELEFEEFCILAARFLIEEDEEQMRRELKEAFRFYDKDGMEIQGILDITKKLVSGE